MLDGHSSTESCTPMTQAFARGREVWRQVSDPLALSLLGLALTITLWGFGYRLSQYRDLFRGSSPRIPVAKLWIEHRFDSAAFFKGATSIKVKTRIYAQSDASALLAAVPEYPYQPAAGVLAAMARPRAVPFFHSAIPLRSPPLAISF